MDRYTIYRDALDNSYFFRLTNESVTFTIASRSSLRGAINHLLIKFHDYQTPCKVLVNKSGFSKKELKVMNNLAKRLEGIINETAIEKEKLDLLKRLISLYK